VDNCELCGRFDSRVRAGECPACIEKRLPEVIGFAGPAGAGKDTAADYLFERTATYVRASFAGLVKAMLAVGLGLDDEQLYGARKHDVDPRYGCSPRHLMQTLGTEWGRELVNRDVWVKALASSVRGRRVIISDVRFDNEAAYVRERGVLVHLVGRGGIEGGHSSEKQLAHLPGDMVVDNMGAVAELYRGLDNAFSI
jgi:hypothetical protein